MPVYKDEKTNTWYVKSRYKDWTGKTKHLTKRGFALKREAVEWETAFFQRQDASLDMSFGDFYQIYREDMGERLKVSTWETKASIIEKKILPFFQDLRMRDITSTQVIRWQNEMMRQKTPDGTPYSQTYLKTLHNQLSAIFNHAVRFYKLSENPARIAGAIGEKDGAEMKIWSEEEYRRFAEAVMDKPLSFYCFEVLYWCGIREGELLALHQEDFDLQKRELHITKTYHRSRGKDIITSPKTRQSVRMVSMPAFLCEELQEYFDMIYDPDPKERIFPVTKSYLNREIQRGAKEAGLRRIRVHDLRHSHVSLLIHMGYSPVAIAFRASPEERDSIKTLAKLSGLTLQEYLIRRCQEKEVVVVGNPRVYKALKTQMERIVQELQRISPGEYVDLELQDTIRMVASIYRDMKPP